LRLKATDIPNNSTVVESSFSIQNNTSSSAFDLRFVSTTIPPTAYVASSVNIQWEGTGLSGGVLDIDYSEDDVNYPPENSIVKNLPLTGNVGNYQWDSSALNLPRVVLRLTARKAGKESISKSGYCTIDNNAPTFPRGGNLDLQVTNGLILLAWNPALDSSPLDYYVYSSDTDNISNYNEILSNNPTKQLFTPYPYLTSIPEVKYFDLGADTNQFKKYWNVVAFDKANNYVVYTSYHGVGKFDESFSSSGQLKLANSSNAAASMSAEEIITDKNSNIIIAGHNDGVLSLWKFDSSGTPDTTFGSNGIPFPNPNNNADTPIIKSIALDYTTSSVSSQYRLYICGQWVGQNGNSELMVLAFDDKGQLDTAFNGGYVNYPMGVYSSCNDITTDSSGNVYVVGEGQASATTSVDALLLRYDNSGKLDNTFSGDGQIILDALDSVSATDIGHGVALDQNGNVLITGTTDAMNTNYKRFMFVARYDSSGNAVNFSVNNRSYFLTDLPLSRGDDIEVDPNGNIIVLGVANNSYAIASAYQGNGVWRFDANGNPDTSNSDAVSGFLELKGESFSYSYPNNSVDLEYLSLSFDQAGNIAVSGTEFFSSDTLYNPLVWYVNADGSIPRNWIFNTYYTSFFNSANAISKAIHIDPSSGTIYSAGYIESQPSKLHIMAIQKN